MTLSPPSILLGLASFRSQALGSLIAAGPDAKHDTRWQDIFQGFASEGASASSSSMLTKAGEIRGLSSTGRNLGLFDTESAFRMMSVINSYDI